MGQPITGRSTERPRTINEMLRSSVNNNAGQTNDLLNQINSSGNSNVDQFLAQSTELANESLAIKEFEGIRTGRFKLDVSITMKLLESIQFTEQLAQVQV